MEPNQTADRLADCRREIDAVDVRILELLNQRTRVVEEIGRIKRSLANHQDASGSVTRGDIKHGRRLEFYFCIS